MALHIAIRNSLLQAVGVPSIHTLPVEEVRAAFRARYAAVSRPEVAGVENRAIPSPGGEIPIRIYRPDRRQGLPVVVFLHGGGFVICDLDTHDALCRHICRRTGMAVVSVGYRLAPEHPYPAAPDDCMAALRWVGRHARDFGGDPGRIALAGDSAGGALAIAAALRAGRESGPAIAAMLLIYPVAGYPVPGTGSYLERGEGFGLTTETMLWFWNCYLDNPSQAALPDACPLRAPDLSGMPPAYVITAEYDPLRDEGALLAQRLREAGVETVHAHYSDMNHGFMYWLDQIDTTDRALDNACHWLIGHVAADSRPDLP